MVRITDRKDWFNVWYQNRQAMLALMFENIAEHIRAGYDFYGVMVTRMRDETYAYARETDEIVDKCRNMSSAEANRWCFYNLKQRGVLFDSDLPF